MTGNGDAAAKEIAKTIMREQNVDNLQGFGDITIGRIERMLMSAYNTGHLMGYSEGFKDGKAND